MHGRWALVFVLMQLASFSGAATAQDYDAALRRYRGIIAATTNSVGYQAEALVAAQKAVRDCGASFEDAGLAIREFMQRDINPARIAEFTFASQNLVEVHGGRLPEVARAVAAAFTRGAGAIFDLDRKYNFLYAATAQQMQNAFNEGKASEARALGFDSFSKQMAAGAAYVRGPNFCDPVILLNPSDLSSFISRGLAYAAKGQQDRAIADFDQAIRLEPNFAFAFHARGLAYTEKGQHERAIQDFDQAIRFHPGYDRAFINRGLAYRALGQQTQAEDDFARARELNPNLPPPKTRQ